MNSSIQWYPGHMAKAKRKISESLTLVDAVVEIVDSRIPRSSRNPDLASLVKSKPQIVLLCKSDLADSSVTRQWLEWFKSQGIPAMSADCRSGKGLEGFMPLLKSTLKEKIEKWQAKGMTNPTVRIMVVGIPNVGKSSFINRMTRGKKAIVGDRPGVTKGNQWFSIDKGVELLDTPGVLWPKFDDPSVGKALAFTGAIKDEILDTTTLASELLEILSAGYPDVLKRYKINEVSGKSGWELLELVARGRSMLIRGGEPDLDRAAKTVLDEFRGGKLGAVSLEKPEEY